MPTEMSSGMPVITLDINEMGQMKQTVAETDPGGATRKHTPPRALSRHSRRTPQCPTREDSKITRRTKFRSR